MKTIFESIPDNIISALGWTLVHSVWQGTLLAAIAYAVFYLLRKKSAAFRYNSGIIILCTQVLVSIATLVYYQSSFPIRSSDIAIPASSSAPLSAIGTNWQSMEHSLSLTAKTQIWLNMHINELVVCWLIGTVLLLFRFAGGWIYTQHLQARSKVVMEKEWRVRFGLLTAKLNISQSVEFRETAKILTPMVIGAFKPVVLIPFGFLTGFPASQVEAILAHELAHIRRNDYLVNMLQSFIEVVFFFHPALWWLSERVRTEREHCCDDIALTICEDKMSLAKALVKVAEWQSAPYLAMAFASKKPLLMQRIRRVLNVTPQPDRLRANWPATLAIFILLAGFSLYATGQKKVSMPEKQTKKIAVKDTQNTTPNVNVNAVVHENTEIQELIEVSPDPVINTYVNQVLGEHQNDSLNKKREQYHQKMQALQSQMEPLRQRMEELNLQMEKENFEIERFEREMEKLDWKKEKVMEAREKLMEKRSALLRADSKQDQSKLTESDLEKQLNEFEQQIKAQEQQITSFNTQIASARKEAEGYKSREPFKSMEREIEEVQTKMDEIGADMGLTSFGLIEYVPAPPAPPKPPRIKKKAAPAAPPAPKPAAVPPVPPTPVIK